MINEELYDKKKEWTYQEAKAWVLKYLIPQGITSLNQFKEYKRSEKYLPLNFPKVPDEYFGRRKKWKGWRDFLGYTKQIYGNQKLSFLEAAICVRENNIKTREQYEAWEDRPQNMPKNPKNTYEKEWVSWENFFLADIEIIKNQVYTLTQSDIRIIKHQLAMGVSPTDLSRFLEIPIHLILELMGK